MKSCSTLAFLVLAVSGVPTSTRFARFAAVAAAEAQQAGGETVSCEGVYLEHGVGKMVSAPLNDDYCDCQSGEDEPGTSACSHLLGSGGITGHSATASASSQPGLFFCKNLGSRPMHIFHSRVGDGICDCCDGTDEAGSELCSNTCDEAGKEWRQAQQQKLAVLREGIAKREDYISRGKELSKNEAMRQDMLAEELALLKAKTPSLEEEKERAEKEEEALKKQAAEEGRAEVLRRSRILEVIGAAAESSEGVSQFAMDLLEFASKNNAVDAFRDFLLERLPKDAEERTSLPLPSQAELDAEAAAVETAAAAAAAEAAATRTSAEVEVAAAGDTTQVSASTIEHTDVPEDPAAAAALAAKIAAEAAANSDTSVPSSDPSDIGAVGETGSAADLPPRQTLSELILSSDAAANSVALPAAEEARSRLEAHRRSVSDKEQEIRTAGGDKEANEFSIEKKYGRDGEFRVLKDKCFEKTVQGYAYKMCFFKDAKQDHVRLGSWDEATWKANGFKDGSQDVPAVVKAKFTGGQRCWNGPARSLDVAFECAGDEVILDVSEPAVCEYNMRFGTPAVCDVMGLEKLERELGEL